MEFGGEKWPWFKLGIFLELLRKTMNTAARIGGVSAEIRTHKLPNTSL
jgi:hypothetical protein